MISILAIMTVLFLLQLLTSFEIKSQLVKEVIYLGLFVVAPLFRLKITQLFNFVIHTNDTT